MLTFNFYLFSSLKNPGFIQGNTLYEVAVSSRLLLVKTRTVEHWSLQSEHGYSQEGRTTVEQSRQRVTDHEIEEGHAQ